MESWSGVMEWSFGVDCGVEWSQILSFWHHPIRLTERQTGKEWSGAEFEGNQ